MAMRSKTIIRFTEEELQNILNEPNSQVNLNENVDYQAALTPICLQDPEAAIYAMLDRSLMTYVPKYKGILLSYKNVRTRKNTGHIDGDNCHIFIDLIIDLYIFTPVVGCLLRGIVSKKSPDGIGCLVHKGFNVAIPRPWDGSNDEWPGNVVNIGDEVTLQVEVLNFCGRLPYIRGKLLKSKLKGDVSIESESATELGDTDHQERNSDIYSDSGELKNRSKKKKRKSKQKSEIDQEEILGESSEDRSLCPQEKIFLSGFEESQILQSPSAETNSAKERKKSKKECKQKLSENNETVAIEGCRKNVIDSTQSNGNPFDVPISLTYLNGTDETKFTCESDYAYSSKNHKKGKKYNSNDRNCLEGNDSKHSTKQFLLKTKSEHGDEDNEDAQLSQKLSQPLHVKYLGRVEKIEDSMSEEEKVLEANSSTCLLNEFMERPVKVENVDCNYQKSPKTKKRKQSSPAIADSNVHRQESNDIIAFLLSKKIKTIDGSEENTSELSSFPQKLGRKRKRSEQTYSENEKEPEVEIKKPRKSLKDKQKTCKSTSS